MKYGENNTKGKGSIVMGEDLQKNLRLLYPLYSDMKIVQMYDKKLISRHARVLITEVGCDGFTFSSYLRLPILENVIWCFQMQLKGNIISLEAVIAGSEVVRNGYLYHTRFIHGAEGTNLQANVQVWMEEMSSAISKATLNYTCFARSISTEGHVDMTC
jgi:hypothetical protein